MCALKRNYYISSYKYSCGIIYQKITKYTSILSNNMKCYMTKSLSINQGVYSLQSSGYAIFLKDIKRRKTYFVRLKMEIVLKQSIYIYTH